MIALRKVDARNIWELVALEVREEQKSFVATNTESILEAYCAVTNGGVALPFGIYDGDTPVGFLMIGYGCGDWEDAPAIARNSYSIWRLMIDKSCQGIWKSSLDCGFGIYSYIPQRQGGMVLSLLRAG